MNTTTPIAKTEAQIRAAMKAKNRRFWKKTKAQQRVAIAKDVLLQLQSKFYTPRTGVYVKLQGPTMELYNLNPRLDQAFQEMKEEGVTCKVCGIGACFVSLVNLGNEVPTQYSFQREWSNGANVDTDLMWKQMGKVFPKVQQSMIENAFEISTNHGRSSSANRERARAFGTRYDGDARKRLIAIMENIIENKGFFKP